MTIDARVEGARSPATVLNAACQCIWLDRDSLRRQLERNLGGTGDLLESRPGLVSGSVAFVDQHHAAAMEHAIVLVQRALSSQTYVRLAEQHAPAIARLGKPSPGGLLGMDFHLGDTYPQLIEINTNPGGLLVNLEIAQAVTGCCDQVAEPLPRLAAGSVSLANLPERLRESFREEWTSVRGDAPLRSIAIVDDDPAGQYLYPEFLLYQRLFERAGWRSPIVDAGGLETRGDGLFADGEPIDLVYNRVTDFYLAAQNHAALRRAYEGDLAVITPHPAAHARWADKRLLAWLRDESLLGEAGLDADERAHLLHTIPPTEIVDRNAADELWRRRKELFFKPVDGYGGKAAYRGDKLTRSTFEHILSNRYVAQAIAPTSMRSVVADGQEAELRVDIRNYCSQGEVWLRAARLYRGQTTNFRTKGGGFAPALTLPGKA
ncbi:MAG: hypothetical protein MUO39_04085 [Steroidobacteraceae bacterium]|nr:hypothetical protein [Steroidobacteraceae bacterium]